MPKTVEDLVDVRVGGNCIQLMMTARVLTNAAGEPVTVFFDGPNDIQLRYPGGVFPFAKNGHTVIVTVSAVQVIVDPKEPNLKPTLIIPGKMN